ncbi:NUDIX hydrolase [Chelatococcus sp. GCM10030263]|uniref:NUDIX hydrolase n=1 Tax=Chelatococcus sp. GCM10030263 TaxID=3273387 RepID=UPI00361C2E27
MVKPWTVSSTRITYQDRWLTVRSDGCVKPDGKVLDPFHVLVNPPWVCIIALSEAQEVILTREYRHGAGIVATGLPGGGLLPREDPAAGAARELAEETGYTCAIWRELGRAYANWSNHTNEIVFMLGSGAALTTTQSLDEGEEIEVVVEPWREYMRRLTAAPAQAFHLAAAFLADRFLCEQAAGRS